MFDVNLNALSRIGHRFVRFGKSIREILEGVRDAGTGQIQVPGIFAAVPYCLDLIGAPYIETDPAICAAFRPRSAQRPALTSAGN